MEFLGERLWLLIPLGVLLAYLVLRIGIGALHMIAAVPADADALIPQTDDVEAFDVRYRCTVCGTEMKLTRLTRPEDDDEVFSAPRHCREEMALVVESDSQDA